MRKKLLRDLHLMVAFAAFRNISDLFLGTFFVSFVMHLAANEILSVSVYKFFEYLATVAGFYIFAHWCKRFGKKTVFTLNLLPKAAVLLLIIFAGDTAPNHIIALGIMYGISASMYHLPMHLMVQEKVSPDAMGKYIGLKNAVGYFTKILAPIILGLFITIGSYTEMACALLAMCVAEFIMIMFLSPSHHNSQQHVDFSGFFCCMRRFPIIRYLFLSEILRGFSISGALGTVITMYTVYMFHTDLNLGIFTTIFSICSILTAILGGRYATRENFSKLFAICTVIAISVMGIFMYWTTPATFLLYNFIYATVLTLMLQISDVNVYNLAQSKCIKSCHRIEYFVLRDSALFIGRWVSLVILMYIGVFGDAGALRYYLAAATIAVMLSGIVSMLVSPRIRMR
ncbi:MAG: MFS transporter [Muribaculaceae bacterium]|nr:MFS transporter [Muribaculaceae bacterium]